MFFITFRMYTFESDLNHSIAILIATNNKITNKECN